MVSTVYCIPYPVFCLPSRLRSSARLSRGRLGVETLVRRTADVLARRNYRTKRIGQVDAFVACPGAPSTSDLEVTRCFLSFDFFFIHSFIHSRVHALIHSILRPRIASVSHRRIVWTARHVSSPSYCSSFCRFSPCLQIEYSEAYDFCDSGTAGDFLLLTPYFSLPPLASPAAPCAVWGWSMRRAVPQVFQDRSRTLQQFLSSER